MKRSEMKTKQSKKTESGTKSEAEAVKAGNRFDFVDVLDGDCIGSRRLDP